MEFLLSLETYSRGVCELFGITLIGEILMDYYIN